MPRASMVRAVSVALVLLLAGCSPLTGRVSSSGASGSVRGLSTIGTDVANASKGQFSEETQRDSDAMHHFLVAQISLGEEDFEKALKNFESAEQLSKEPTALVYTRLADLYLRFGQLEKALVAAQKAIAQEPKDPYVRMLYAGVLESVGREAEAEPLYRGLVDEFPDKVDGYLLLSNLYVKKKNFDQALSILQKLVKNQPKEPIGHFYLGRVYEYIGKLDKAEAEYTWVFENDPTLSSGSTELVRVLARQQKIAKVKAVCERMLEKDPNNALARKVLGQIMIGESKLDDALQHLTVLEKVEEDSTDTRFKVALIQIEKQNYREAIRELSLVLAKDPKHAEARYYLASIYAGSGRHKDAVEELIAIDKANPMYVKARTFAAFILRQSGDFDEALDVIDDALTIEPDNINLTLYSVLILRDLDDPKQAEKRLRAALIKHPNDERLLFNLGLVLHERDNESEAVSAMEQIIKVNDKNSDALNYVAYSLAQQGRDLERAETLVRRALEMRPSDGYYLDTLGFIQFKKGKMSDAEESLARAVAVTGDDAVIIEHYVDALIALGKYQKAVAVLKAIAERDPDAKDDEDREKREARKRLKKRLEELLSRYPELRSIQKTKLLTTPPQKSPQARNSIESLIEVPALGGAS